MQTESRRVFSFAEVQPCPVFTGKEGKRLHIGFDDPDSFKGTEEEILPEFRRVRDEIMEKMTEFINQSKN